jgi:phospholipid/cholesterol/gamma-HCH transport system ATP-binding protein
MIEIKNIKRSFRDKSVLNGISAVFETGKTNLIIGQSGSGKTVLIKCIVGLFQLDSGIVTYDNRDFYKANFKAKKDIRKEIGMVFQGGALFTSETVEDNVMFPLNMFSKMSKKEKLNRVNECLDRVNIAGTNDLYPGEISGGMQKRVAIARAIVLNPKYLICDEPNSGLDPQTAIKIDLLIKNITEEYNITTVINTHDMNSVMQIGMNIIFLNKGLKWWSGTKSDIFHSGNQEFDDFIFASELSKKLLVK